VSLSGFVRMGGLFTVVGGVLLVISDLWGLLSERFGDGQPFSEVATTTSFALTSLLSLLAAVLILFGLVGLHLRQAERAGVLGWVGFFIAFIGTALVVGVSWTLFFVAPSVAVEAPEFLDAEQVAGPLDTGFILSFSILAVGWAVFGLGALISRAYPRWIAIVLIVAALIQLLPFPGTGLVFGVAVALVGFFSLAGGGMSGEQRSRVT
jgi:hypothetical protein